MLKVFWLTLLEKTMNKPPVLLVFVLSVLSLIMALFTMSIAVTAFFSDKMFICFFAGFAAYFNLSNFIKGMALAKSLGVNNESNSDKE